VTAEKSLSLQGEKKNLEIKKLQAPFCCFECPNSHCPNKETPYDL